MKVVLVLFFMMMFTSVIPVQGSYQVTGSTSQNAAGNESVERVICNVIDFVQKLGLPL